MVTTSKIGINLLESNTNNKYVIHNDAVVDLEALAGGTAISYWSTTTPPTGGTISDIYIVPAGATGVWTGQVNNIARWTGTGWQFYIPYEGQVLYVQDINDSLTYASGTWQPVNALDTNPISTSTTLTVENYGEEIITTGSITVSIPDSAGGFPIGWQCLITKDDAATTLTVDRASGGTSGLILYNNINTWTIQGTTILIYHRGANVWRVSRINA